jgi:hypothetical protein
MIGGTWPHERRQGHDEPEEPLELLPVLVIRGVSVPCAAAPYSPAAEVATRVPA